MEREDLVADALDLISGDLRTRKSVLDEESTEMILSDISYLADTRTKISAYQAADKLKISKKTFDKYVSDGKLPEGRHQQGFKEKFYQNKDIMEMKKALKK